MVRSNTQALAVANKTTRNTPGMCQKVTRDWFGAPSAGDQDADRDADAVDGWLSEPLSARVPGDRNPPPGAPLYFKNRVGNGHGHRCISRVDGARSTDMSNGRYAPGITGNATIEQIEDAMGLEYVGWSRTITGIPIPGLEKKAEPSPKPDRKTSRGVRVDRAIDDTKQALKAVQNSRKGRVSEPRGKHLELAEKQLTSALKNLEKVPLIR